ncbi:hypothetical protein Pmani_007691 [Petrolisthes manimaculis]|nr:hypothetical protein Pmani_007691 [Petrolisthes manimaculis]
MNSRVKISDEEGVNTTDMLGFLHETEEHESQNGHQFQNLLSGKMDHVEVEMTEAEPGEDDEDEDGQQNEYSELLSMEPLTAEMSHLVKGEKYERDTAEDYGAAFSEEEEVLGLPHTIATIEADEVGEENFLELSAEMADETEEEEDSLPEPVDRKNQEELINRLMTDGMSFSEVAALWGEGTDADSDVEDSPPVPSQTQEVKEDHAAEFEKELNEQQRYQLKRKGGKEKRRRRRLPAALQGLMGEANLRYAHREYDEAIKMCMEVIRQFSHAPEPYQTLGMIYEEKKMVNKSLQFLLIAAFLSPNAEEWEKLADLSCHQGDLQQAVFCWGRAIKANPQNLNYHWARCNLLEHLGEKLKALKGYTHMLKYLQTDQGKDGLKLAKEIAQIHYENKDVHLARNAMETAFKKYPSYVTAVDVNLILEVLMHQQEYQRCVEVLVLHSGVRLLHKDIPEEEFSKWNLENQLGAATECFVPLDLLIDLRTKLTIALIHIRAIELAAPLVDLLMNESEETFGDLYLDIAEAYMSAEFHEVALTLLRPLIKSERFSVAAVCWLKFGECLAAVDQMEEAAQAYSKVVQLAPQHAEARLTLSPILQSLGRLDEALLILNQEKDSEPLDSNLLYQRCKILLEQDHILDFINAAKLLFRRHFIHIRNKDEAEAMLNNKKLSNKYEAIRELRRSKSENLEDNGPAFTGPDVKLEDQWELFSTLCHILHEQKRFEELERMTFSALGSKEFMRDKERAREIEFMCLLACIYNDSSYFAYNIMRELVIKNPESNRCWNLLNLIISKADDFRHNRFLLRLTHKHPDLVALGLLNGHNCLVAGTYKYSLAEYTQAFKQDKSNPIIPLMLGLTFTHMACQKFSGKKHSLVVQALAFLNTYVEMRGECQESMYNLGRAHHQLNLLPQAIHYYKLGLECPPAEEPPEETPDGPRLDLSREIAFNLSLIYQNSGSPNVVYKMGCCGDSGGGPSKEEERKPTDVIWLIAFFLFLVLMIFIAAFALVFGNPLRVVNGYDSFGNVCGSDNADMKEHREGLMIFSGHDVSEYKYVLFFDVYDLSVSLKVCVQECPDRTLNTLQDIHDFYARTGSKLCRYDYDKYDEDVSWVDSDNPNINASLLLAKCPKLPIYQSNPVLNRCVPLKGEGPQGMLYNLYGYLNTMDILEQVLADLYASWHIILIFIFLTLGLSCAVMLCLHFMATIVSYAIMIAVFVASVAATILLWWSYGSIRYQLDHSPDEEILEENVRNERALLVYAIISTIIMVALIALVVYVRPHITMVAELFKHAGGCLARHPTLLLQPVITFFVLLAFFLLWVWVMVSLATAKHLGIASLQSEQEAFSNHTLNETDFNSTSSLPKSTPQQVLEYSEPTWVRSLWWVWVLGLVWVAEFILACQQMIIASAVSTWYFTRQETRGDRRHPVWWSWRTLLLYHLGTVAKGSLLITLCKLPRLIIQWVTKKCRDPEHSCARCGLRLCCCCLWCFEHFLKYMNHNAYTVTATRGTPFCTSAKIAWRVVLTNMLQVATVNSVGDLMLFLAKVAVTGTVCCIALPVLHADPTLHLYAVPLIVTAVFAFFITHCVFSVYEMAVDTLFLCFSDDYNTYDTTDGRDLVADKELYEFMVKHEDIDYKKNRSNKARNRRDPPETIRFKEGTV